MKKIFLSFFALLTTFFVFGQDLNQENKITEVKAFFEQLTIDYNFFPPSESELNVKIPAEFIFLNESTIVVSNGNRIKFNYEYFDAPYLINRVGNNVFVLLHSSDVAVKFEFYNSNSDQLVFRNVQFSATGF